MTKSKKWKDVDEALVEAVKSGVFPGAVLLVAKPGSTEYLKAIGRTSVSGGDPIKEDAVFDVASLTKALCTMTVIMSLVRESKINLDDKLEKFFRPHEISEGLVETTIEDILSHSAGIKSYVPFFSEVMKRGNEFVGTREAKEFIFEKSRMEKLAYGRNENFEYSDLGFIILTEIVEKITKRNFSDLCKERIFNKLSMSKSAFIPWRKESWKEIFGNVQVVPTEFYPWLGKEACGIVHDENCYVMGGISGHAGLFATAMDISRFIEEIFKGWEGKSDLLPKDLCKKFFSKRRVVEDSPWALGWETPSKEGSSSGDYFSKDSIGHLGYTGCSIWIDLEAKVGVTLLSNRVNPTRKNEKIKEFRPKMHNLVRKVLGY